MIKFNEEFSFERDKYNWILDQTVPGHDKDGAPKDQHRYTYHGTLAQACGTIIELSVARCETLEEVIHLLTHAKEELVNHVENNIQGS